MEIKHEDNGLKGAFYIELKNIRVGEMTYVWVGKEKIIIDHTQVGDALKGMGAGKLMLAAAVDFARKKEIKILPLCPFAKSVFEKESKYCDVL